MTEATGWFRSFIEANMVYIEKIPTALIVLIIAYGIIRLTQRVIIAATSLAKVDRTVQTMIRSAIGFVGWVLALAAVLNVMELSEISLALGGSIALVRDGAHHRSQQRDARSTGRYFPPERRGVCDGQMGEGGRRRGPDRGVDDPKDPNP